MVLLMWGKMSERTKPNSNVSNIVDGGPISKINERDTVAMTIPETDSVG